MTGKVSLTAVVVAMFELVGETNWFTLLAGAEHPEIRTKMRDTRMLTAIAVCRPFFREPCLIIAGPVVFFPSFMLVFIDSLTFFKR